MPRQIEILEDVLRDDARHYVKGDIITVDDAKAAEWIHYGWAKCVQTGEVGERKPGPQKLYVHDVKQTTTASE